MRPLRDLRFLAVMSCAVAWVGCDTPPAVIPVSSGGPSVSATALTESSSQWSDSAVARIAAGEYAPTFDGHGVRMSNRTQRLVGLMDADGLRVTPLEGGGGEVRLSLRQWGRGGAEESVGAGSPVEGPCASTGAIDPFGECVRRVNVDHGGLVEWWENGPAGLEQGFDVSTPPVGDGPLVFDVSIEGGSVQVDGDEVVIARRSGDPLRYGSLAAWDERGASLPVWVERSEDGVRLLVDDSSAVGAVTVDPLLTAEGWSVSSGQQGSWFGRSVSSAGDVNGDGYADVVVGAPFFDNGEMDEGRAFLYLGSAFGLSNKASWTAESDQSMANFGWSVSSAGDVNADGYADVLVGAPYFGNGQGQEGRAFLYLGSASGLSATPAWTSESDQQSALFGNSVSSAGDVNRDGFGDVIVGAPQFDDGQADEGRAFVYLGSATGLSATASWSAEADQAVANFGRSVASAGDVNGDGYADVVVGAPYFDNGEADEGRTFVYLGGLGGLSATHVWTAEANQASAQFGWSVASGGDVNGDGFGDLIVGAVLASHGEQNEGQAFVYLGTATGLAATAAWTGESNQDGAHFGAAVSSAGDVNGDGYGDLLVGAPDYADGEAREGRAYLYFGRVGGPSTSPSWTAESDHVDALLGAGVSAAGDVNGDGYGDLILGASTDEDGGLKSGRAYLSLGSAGGLSAAGAWTAESDQASARFGSSVAAAGDVNGDGFGDVVVGAPTYSNGQPEEGRAFLYFGSAGGLSANAAWTAESNEFSAQFGLSVAGAGDVNGDGFADVVVGAHYHTGGQYNEGAAYLYLGSAGGLSGTPSWVGEPNAADAEFGYTVASAGDVNGDGYADVLVGAPFMASGEAAEGRAYLFLGNAGGLSPSASWTVESNQTSAFLGWSVSSAGDVNGDGFADVVVGAPSFDSGQTNEGRAFVYLGSAGGLSGTAAWTGESDQGGGNFGSTVSSAGDVNGDGYADVVVGAPAFDGVQLDEGRTYVYHGSASGLSTSASWTAGSGQASSGFGRSAASAGDVDGDGYADLLVGAPSYDAGETDEGRAYLYYGSSNGLPATPSWTSESNQASAFFGSSVACAGDVDGDGYGDIVVGAHLEDDGQTNEGVAQLYLGAPSGLPTLASWNTESNQASAQLGRSVSSAGDVNGDGYGDVLVGASAFDNGEVNEGRAFLYLGSATGSSVSVAWIAESDVANGSFGSSTSSAGDVNGDGYGDVIVGAPYLDNGQAAEGRAFLYLGSSSGVSATVAWTAESDQAGASFGASVASAGDVNGDGFGDVIVGAPYFDDGQSSEGMVSLFLGSAAGLSVTPAWTFEPDQANAELGGSVASAGDVNGDGFGDVVVGARVYSNGQASEGRAFLFLGSAVGLAALPSWTAELDLASAQFAGSVASAGDVNGDGFGDVVIGAVMYDHGQADEGGAFLYLGSSAGLSATPSWTAESDQASAAFGRSVASAGDVNGDGFGDVVVGASGYDNGETNEGRAYLYLGSWSGLSATTSWTGESDQASAGYGWSVASVGDVNGDGYGDVGVGALSYDHGETDEGRAYVYLGNAGDGTGAGVPLLAQARQASTTTPIAAWGASTSTSDFDVALRARNPFGRHRTQVEVEAKRLGEAFDGQGLVVSPWSNAPANTTVQQALTGLTTNTVYHWRARVRVAPSEGTPQLYGPWTYGGLSGAVQGVHTRTAGILWYVDADADSFGDPGAMVVGDEVPPAGYVASNTDCNDAALAINPAATEVCDPDDVDEDCDGLADDADPSVVGQPSWYADGDQDGYGAGSAVVSCEPQGGRVTTDDDCNDGVAGINPGASEVCDPSHVDEDCDGFADDLDVSGPPVVGMTSWYTDADEDGFGAGVATSACEPPAGMVATDDDCNDAVAAANPDGTEVCDPANLDEDCDGAADDQDVTGAPPSGTTPWYADGDGDGYGAGAPAATACDAPPDLVASSTDCDDGAVDIHPNAVDIPGDGIDQDCVDGDATSEDTDVPHDTDAPHDTDLPDFGDTDSDAWTDTHDGKPGGCKCATTDRPSWGGVLGLLLVATAQRRRSPIRRPRESR